MPFLKDREVYELETNENAIEEKFGVVPDFYNFSFLTPNFVHLVSFVASIFLFIFVFDSIFCFLFVQRDCGIPNTRYCGHLMDLGRLAVLQR